MKKPTEARYPVKSLVKALQILDFLGGSEQGESLTSISSKLKLGKSTVHRLLATLRDHDFVWVEPDSSNYVLGAKILQFSDQIGHQNVLVRYGNPILKQLSQNTNETCNLGVREGNQVLYLIKKESENVLRMSGRVGKRFPAHCTALGKVLLSELTSEELRELYPNPESLETVGPSSISTLAELERQLKKVRQVDLAFDNEEMYPGVVCVAAAVRNYRGEIVAAMSVSFPKHRMEPTKLEEFKSLVPEAGRMLSRQLGYMAGAARATK